jgi:hypothetical protein
MSLLLPKLVLKSKDEESSSCSFHTEAKKIFNRRAFGSGFQSEKNILQNENSSSIFLFLYKTDRASFFCPFFFGCLSERGNAFRFFRCETLFPPLFQLYLCVSTFRFIFPLCSDLGPCARPRPSSLFRVYGVGLPLSHIQSFHVAASSQISPDIDPHVSLDAFLDRPVTSDHPFQGVDEKLKNKKKRATFAA